MLLCICDLVFSVSNPWMHVLTWSSDDNALVANFAFPAPLRDESLLAPFDIDWDSNCFFSTHAAQPATSSLSMKLYEIVWKQNSWPRGVASVARPERYKGAIKASVADTCHRRGWTTCWICLDSMSGPGTFTLRTFVCVNCQTKNAGNHWKDIQEF